MYWGTLHLWLCSCQDLIFGENLPWNRYSLLSVQDIFEFDQMTMFLETHLNKMACVGVKTQSINTEFQRLFMDYSQFQQVM